MKRNVITMIFGSLLVSFSVISTPLLAKPLEILLSNPIDFDVSLIDFMSEAFGNALPYLSCLFAISFLILLREKIAQYWVALMMSLTVLFWFQCNILNWNYGALDGTPIEWGGYWYRELVDITIWMSFLIFALNKKRYIYNNILPLTVTLIVIQLLPVAINILASERPSENSTIQYGIDKTKQFAFSKEKNVFVLVLDAISNTVAKRIIENNPEFKKELDGFVRFDNMLGAGGQTTYSVPVIISGKPYLNAVAYKDYAIASFTDESSILRTLTENGWNTGFYKTNLIPSKAITPRILTEITQGGKPYRNSVLVAQLLALYAGSPQSVKRYLYKKYEIDSIWEDKEKAHSKESGMRKTKIKPFPNHSSDLIFMNNMLSQAAVTYSTPSLKYYHLSGAHRPFRVDKDLKRKDSSYEEMVYVSLKIAVRFIHILKEMGIYDSSQIYLMTDHGSYKTTSDPDIIKTLLPQYANRAAAMFMFKDFSRRGSLVSTNIALSDYDFPKILLTLAEGEDAHKNNSSLLNLVRKDRLFYMARGSNSDGYSPEIVELAVHGDVNDLNSWSMTGRTFLPATAKERRVFDCITDELSLTNQNDYLHYVRSGIEDSTGATRNRAIKFRLPIAADCANSDIEISITLAAVLGTNTKTGKKVTSRRFVLEAGNRTSSVQHIDTENHVNFTFLYPKEEIDNNYLSFTLLPLDVIPNGDFVDLGGKKQWTSALRLRKLSIAQPNAAQDYIKLENMPH